MKLIINENILNKMAEDKLPTFILKAILNDNHSLAKQPSFPIEHVNRFEIDLLNERYKDILKKMESFNLENLNIDTVSDKLNETYENILKLEEPLHKELEELCNKIVKDIFIIGDLDVDFNCTLGEPTTDSRPDTPTNDKFSFSSVAQNREINDIIYQRRIINSLILGLSQLISRNGKLFVEDIYHLNPELLTLYSDINVLNDFLLFNNDKIDSNIKVGNVDVNIFEGGVNSIVSSGKIFPVLLFESVKGFLDLISFNALPKDEELIEYILNKSDFKEADAWDSRFGYSLAKIISNQVDDIKLLPFVFYGLLSEDVEKFNENLQEIFSETKYAHEYINNLVGEVGEQIKLLNLTNTIIEKNNNSKLNDNDYFSLEEL